MKKFTLIFFIISICASCTLFAQNFLDTKDAYFGLTPPGLIPEVFAPGIVTDTSWQEHCQMAISPRGDEIYWSKFSDGVSEQIYFSKFINNKWTKPELADFIKDDLTLVNGQPTFSPDGNKLFFYSRNRPGGLGYIDAWYVERIDYGWSKPINAGPLLNTEGDDRPPIITEKGNAYTMGRNFAEDKVNYLRLKYTDGEFSHPTPVSTYKDFPYWWPLYVSPDESYRIFPSVNKAGFGGLDLYICYKDENDHWGEPINLGPEINTNLSERFPIVSPDGKYLFFMRHTDTWDILWVSTEIFDKLRKRENDIKPYKILEGHTHKVQNAFFSPDGQLIISHGWDNTVKIWDAQTFLEARTLKGHKDQVWSAAISPDNKLLVSGSMDRTFIIWDAKTGEIQKQVQISPDTVTINGIIPEFDIRMPNSIYSVSFSPNGKKIAIASADKLVRIWDLEKSAFIDTLNGHHTTNWMWARYSSDGKYLISGSTRSNHEEGVKVIWETETYGRVSRIVMSGSIIFTEENELGIYTGNNSMNYYNLSDGSLVNNKTFPDYKGYFNMSPDKRFIASCNEDSYIILRNVETQEVVWTYKNEGFEIHNANFSPDGKYLIAGTPESDILVWKLSELIKDE